MKLSVESHVPSGVVTHPDSSEPLPTHRSKRYSFGEKRCQILVARNSGVPSARETMMKRSPMMPVFSMTNPFVSTRRSSLSIPSRVWYGTF